MFSITSKTIFVALLFAFACAPEGDDRATTPTDVAGGANKVDPPPQTLPPVGGGSTGEGGGSDGPRDENSDPGPSEGDDGGNGQKTETIPNAERVGDFRAYCGKGNSARDEAIGCRVTAASGLAADDRKITAVYALRTSGTHTKLDIKTIAGSQWSVVFALPEGAFDGYAVLHTDVDGKDLARDDYVP